MAPITLTWLGTGNFLVPGARYWNSFVVEADNLTVLVEPSPTVLPNLCRAGYGVEQLDVVVISHFHPDHTFGWPFLLLEIVRVGRDRPLFVVGPPGAREYLGSMMRLGSVLDIEEAAAATLDIRHVEAAGEGTAQQAGPLRFEAVEVIHVPELTCFGYLLELPGHRLGYSGDTTPCGGLDQLAANCDTLVLECSGIHASASHMHVDAAASMTQRFPGLRLIATHLGEGVDAASLPGVTVPDDFDRLTL
ncbi:MAG: MBL fold metallo-hydrolase [Acidimicrobiales bacterium]